MNKGNKITKLDYFIVFLLVGIVPFLVYGLQYELPLADVDGNTKTYFDYFNLLKVRTIKGVAFLIATNYTLNFLTTLKSFYEIKESIKENFNKIYFFCLMIVLSAIIAFIFSEDKSIALTGAIERFESLWIHFSYLIIYIYFINYFKKENSFKIFSYAILLSTFVVGSIGTLQFVGSNPFEYAFVQRLTIPRSIGGVRISQLGSYSTMYNINTSASYSVFMLHILLIILLINKNKIVKIISIIDLILIGITFYNSLSEASYIAFAGSVVACILLSVFLLLSNKKYKAFGTVVLTGVIILIGGITFILNNNTINAKIKNIVSSAIGEPTTFTDWYAKGNEVTFYNKDGEYIKVVTNEDEFEVFENEEKLLSTEYENNKQLNIETHSFKTLQLAVFNDTNNDIRISFNDYFYIIPSNQIILESIDDFTELYHYDYFGFDGYGRLFTNRGYIWSRSLTMFFNKPFGYGADTFFLNFPNNDDVGRAFNSQVEIVDKPHNIFLNMAINNGFLYLIGFLGIVVVVMLDKLKLLYTNENMNVNKRALIIYICGMVAYLINGIATDNLVVIIMLFWCYLAFNNSIFTDSLEKGSK